MISLVDEGDEKNVETRVVNDTSKDHYELINNVKVEKGTKSFNHSGIPGCYPPGTGGIKLGTIV